MLGQQPGDLARARQASTDVDVTEEEAAATIRQAREDMDRRIAAFIERQHEDFDSFRRSAMARVKPSPPVDVAHGYASMGRRTDDDVTRSSVFGDSTDRRWSDTTSTATGGGTDSAVPPSPLSLVSTTRSPADADLSEHMLYGEELDFAPPTPPPTADARRRRRHNNRRAPPPRLSDGSEADSDDSGTYANERRWSQAQNTTGTTDNQEQQRAVVTPTAHTPQTTPQRRQRTPAGGRRTNATTKSTDTTHAVEGAGRLCAMGVSLPVTIRAQYWPPREAVDSRPSSEDEGDDDGFGEKQPKNVCLPHRVPKNPHDEIVAISRSIQAADDPERLFGERPNRRRYRTGDKVNQAITRAAAMPADLFVFDENE